MDNLKINFKEFILKNGLKLIVLKRDCKFFNFNFGLKVGSAYETDNERGFSHFIEHMLFRSNSKFKDYEINKVIEFLGGNYDAFTDYGMTVLSMSGLLDDLEKSVELFSSMIMYPKFNDEEMNIERDIIISEIESSYASYEDYSFLKLNEEAFDTFHIKYDVAGNRESLENVTGDDLRKFYNKYYVPNNAYAVIISSYNEDYVLSLFERFFNSWQSKPIVHKELAYESNIPKTIVSEKDDLDVSTITYLFTFNDLNRNDKVFLKLAEYKLGGSPNSILFKKIREQEGLAYDVYTQLDLSDEFKGMYIFCTTSNKNIERVIQIIDYCVEMMKSYNDEFDQYNLDLMKKLQLISIYSTFEDHDKLGLYLIEKMIYKIDIESYIDDLRIIENTNSQQLVDICKKYFNNPTIHILKRK